MMVNFDFSIFPHGWTFDTMWYDPSEKDENKRWCAGAELRANDGDERELMQAWSYGPTPQAAFDGLPERIRRAMGQLLIAAGLDPLEMNGL